MWAQYQGAGLHSTTTVTRCAEDGQQIITVGGRRPNTDPQTITVDPELKQATPTKSTSLPLTFTTIPPFPMQVVDVIRALMARLGQH